MTNQITSENVTFSNLNQEYINHLVDICGFDSEDKVNYGSVAMSLFKVKNLPFIENIVKVSIEESIIQTEDFNAYSITEKFVEIYSANVLPMCNQTEIEEITNENFDVWFQYSTFCTHALPENKTELTEITTQYPNNKLSIECVKGLPFGGIARMIVLFVNSEAVKYRNQEINIGKSIKSFVESLGYKSTYVENGINDQVLTQLSKLFHTTFFQSKYDTIFDKNGKVTLEEKNLRFHLFDQTISWTSINDGFKNNQQVIVKLSDVYFAQILKHPVPLSLDALKFLKKSPLAIDLYSFLCYRSNTGRLLPIKIKNLQKQFGNTSEAWRFKEKLDRALTYIIKIWPECKVIIKKDVMIIPKLKPHISSHK